MLFPSQLFFTFRAEIFENVIVNFSFHTHFLEFKNLGSGVIAYENNGDVVFVDLHK